ncbi:MAG TPA: AAA family ATPase [Candidatus Atribacteria bacterium]|nr:AAA family ATPase [Candidatus Atribacteria bacterium]
MIREIEKEQYFYPEVKEIVSNSLESTEGKVILIVGQPGSGKSVFMSQLYDEFKKREVEYLTAIRAEFLNETDSPKDVYELFTKVKDVDKPKVLLLDSLDVLAYSRRRKLQEWLFYIDNLKKIKRMIVVCASRSFEAEHLYPMNEQEWSEKIYIRLLPDEFIDKVLSKVNYDYNSISSEFRKFLRIPLHLRITVEIIKNGGDPKNIFDLHGLYAKLFEVLKISTEEMSLLMQLSELMIKNRTIYLPYSLIGIPLLNKIKEMKDSPGIMGIVQIDSRNQRISFSHQTLIDYLSALKVLNENKSIADFVVKHGQSLFIRPTIRHILGLLRILSQKRLFEELEKIFFKKYFEKKIGFGSAEEKSIRLHIKTAILANMASWNNPTIEEGKFLLRLFNEAEDGQQLMIQFFNNKPTSGWYEVLKEIYILPILKKSDEEDIKWRIIISFLADIAKDKLYEVLDICLFLLEKQKHSITLEWFIRKVSDEISKIELEDTLKEKYTQVLEQAIRKGIFSWYYEIVISCKRMAKYSPEKALQLYFECVLKELKNKNSKIISSQGSLTKSFEKILPSLYEKVPYETLLTTTNFFEQILVNNYVGKKRLWDNPNELLYSQHAQRFGLNAFYEWYKNKILEFCSSLTEPAKQIIEKLEQSKWESQRQLSMLCKLRNIDFYKNDILDYIRNILKSSLENSSMYRQSELFIRTIERVFKAKVIEEEEKEEIINEILSLDFDDDLQARVWIWEPLHHIPEKYRNEKVKQRLKEIREKFNFEEEYKYTPPIESTGVKVAQPIAKADELRKKSPEELYEFLIKNRDLKGRWDLENDIFYGGVRELAQEVAKVFVEDLRRYREVLIKLAKDSANDEYISWFFIEVSKKGINEEYIDWLIELVFLVYKRENLQREIIFTFEKVREFLTERHFCKVKNTLLEFSKAKDPEEDKFFEYRKQGYSNDALTEGINSTRGSLIPLAISLLHKFEDNLLLEILEKLSKDKTISVRAVLVRYLPYAIKPIGWDKCFELFSNAFEKGAEEYVECITDFLRCVPQNKFEQVKEIIDKIWKKRNGKLGIDYALLMGIYYLRGFVSGEDLMNVFKDKELIEEGKEECFNLLANQVKFKENVDKCLKIISNLLDTNFLKGRLSILFMQARPEDFKKFVPIIEKIIRKPKVRGEALYYTLEYLEKSILFDPLEVFNLLENLLSNVGEDFYNLRDYIPASHSKAPLNIINTILECYPEEENRALEALDKLIKLNWEGVNEYLYALDRF